MGYKVLQAGASFASQVTDENTIYEIRDVFDLNNGSVTIPNGCTLKFNGGCINNGTVVCNETQIINPIGNGSAVFKNGYNLNTVVLRTSEIGMIPNNANYAQHNGEIIDNAIAKHCSLIVDELYYINEGHEIDYNFEAIGENNGGFQWPSDDDTVIGLKGVFEIVQGGSINFDSLTVISANNTLNHHFVFSEISTDSEFVIDTIRINNCDISGGNFLKVLCDDIDFSQTRFGLNHSFITNNYIHDIDVINRSTAANPVYAIDYSDCPIIKDNLISCNIANNVNGVVFSQSINNRYGNSGKYLKEETSVICRANKLDCAGHVYSQKNYHCLLLVEKLNCEYYNNNVTNVITLTDGQGEASDCYINCNNVYYFNNECKNIANINYTDNDSNNRLPGVCGFARCKTVSLLGETSSRRIESSILINDCEEIYNAIKDESTFPSETKAEFFEYLNTCQFEFGSNNVHIDTVCKKNNLIDLGEFQLKNTDSYIDVLVMDNNNMNFYNCYGSLCRYGQNGAFYFTNNYIKGFLTEFYRRDSSNVTDAIFVCKGNIFAGSCVTSFNNAQLSFSRYIYTDNYVSYIDGNDNNSQYYTFVSSVEGFIEKSYDKNHNSSIRIYDSGFGASTAKLNVFTSLNTAKRITFSQNAEGKYEVDVTCSDIGLHDKMYLTYTANPAQVVVTNKDNTVYAVLSVNESVYLFNKTGVGSVMIKPTNLSSSGQTAIDFNSKNCDALFTLTFRKVNEIPTSVRHTIDTSGIGQNITINNNATSIGDNKTYLATLEADTGYNLNTVTVEMDGTDITSFVYNTSTGVLYIPSVIGDIVITATASQS